MGYFIYFSKATSDAPGFVLGTSFTRGERWCPQKWSDVWRSFRSWRGKHVMLLGNGLLNLVVFTRSLCSKQQEMIEGGTSFAGAMIVLSALAVATSSFSICEDFLPGERIRLGDVHLRFGTFCKTMMLLFKLLLLRGEFAADGTLAHIDLDADQCTHMRGLPPQDLPWASCENISVSFVGDECKSHVTSGTFCFCSFCSSHIPVEQGHTQIVTPDSYHGVLRRLSDWCDHLHGIRGGKFCYKDLSVLTPKDLLKVCQLVGLLLLSFMCLFSSTWTEIRAVRGSLPLIAHAKRPQVFKRAYVLLVLVPLASGLFLILVIVFGRAASMVDNLAIAAIVAALASSKMCALELARFLEGCVEGPKRCYAAMINVRSTRVSVFQLVLCNVATATYLFLRLGSLESPEPVVSVLFACESCAAILQCLLGVIVVLQLRRVRELEPQAPPHAVHRAWAA